MRDAAAVFKFAADNSEKEWKLDVYKDSYGNMKAVVATNMDFIHVSLTDAYDDEHAKVKSMSKIVDIHSHPDKDGTRGGSDVDLKNANQNSRNAVYHKMSKTLYEYNENESSINAIEIRNSDELYKYLKK